MHGPRLRSERVRLDGCRVAVLILIVVLGVGMAAPPEKEPVDYVNTFIGATYEKETRYNYGNTHVGSFRPFAMVKPGPDTEASGLGRVGNGGYKYNDSTILGFSQLHMSGTGGRASSQSLSVMPTVGEVVVDEDRYRSRFNHEKETSRPGYYQVRLLDYDINAEVASTDRVALYRFTFPESEESNILINVAHAFNPYRGGKVRIVDDRTIVGTGRYRGYKDSPYDIAFRIELSKPFARSGVWHKGNVRPGTSSASAGDKEPLGAFVRYDTKENEEVLVKISISYVDQRGARKNMEEELPHWRFDETKDRSLSIWNELLGQADIEGGSEAQRIKFYTALYHSYTSPSVLSDVDGRYEGYDGKVHRARDFKYYGEFSLWDTYRTVHPLLALLQPSRQSDMVKSLIKVAEQGGWLPKWGWTEGYTGGMLGDHAVSVIADSYVKGITDFDAEAAYRAMHKNAMSKPKGVRWGRRGIRSYKELGYVPEESDVDVHGSASTTLEFAYNDWCVAQMAQALGKEEDYRYFRGRAYNYKNVFDPRVKFMRPRRRDGSWAMEPFAPTIKGRGRQFYAEGNAWTYTWLVPHDPQGLINLFGGRQAFTTRLDSVFAGPTFKQMHYWHDNEPDMHYAYMYDYAGQPWKTQKLVRRIMDEVYGIGPFDGLPHADDAGTMSAWYVLSALGMYPMAPGETAYPLGSPIFEKVTLHLSDEYYGGNDFVIEAKHNSQGTPYVQSAALNGEPLGRPWITHKDIVEGEKIIFRMGDKPNKAWGSSAEAAPPSMTTGRPKFVYSDPKVPEEIIMDEPVELSATVTNEGAVGTAYSKLYYLDNTGEMPGKMKLLEEPTVLGPGEQKQVSFRVPFYRGGKHYVQIGTMDPVPLRIRRR